jgi:hypothetical protein
VPTPDVPTYEVEDCSIAVPEYHPTNKEDIILKSLGDAHRQRIVLNVGGRRFETSKPTLRAEPHCLLAAMISEESIKPYTKDGIEVYFVDRNPRFFDFILDYLRDPLRFHRILPNNKQILRQIHLEATYYMLTGLCNIIERKGQNANALWED